MIRVFYDGNGYQSISHAGKGFYDDELEKWVTTEPERSEKISASLSVMNDGIINIGWHQEFYLPEIVENRLNLFGVATVDCLIPVKQSTSRHFFYITDENDEPDSFEINKEQSIYIHENGNALKLILDDEARAPAPPDTEKPLSENERTTMLKLIYGMALDGYGYDATIKKNPFTGEGCESLKSILQTRGIEIDSDTIRKYLQAGYKLCTQKN